MPLRVERAQPADRDTILALLEASGLPSLGLVDHLDTTLVARRDDRIVASAALEMYGPSALLRSVAVDAALRGTGLGRRMTSAALDLARVRGVREVFLLTETAAGFFPRFGFARISRARCRRT